MSARSAFGREPLRLGAAFQSKSNEFHARRTPLIVERPSGLARQGLELQFVLARPLGTAWAPLTGMACLLFTFYSCLATGLAAALASSRAKAGCGAAVAAARGASMVLRSVFRTRHSSAAACGARGILLSGRSACTGSTLVGAPATTTGTAVRKPSPDPGE